ncbi:hypothetical protein DFQ30_004707 [Apophysomyces sp. BC1015]|nr:hypothetical protein DFQ30_004707 [Apophysomyces sp. BC1015]KAG0177907.1 hypothetical protein DFQ29_004171 [Apophysomyces sp. BC1021]
MSRNQTVYVSGYSGEDNKGIYAYDFDTTTGQLTECCLAAESKNPSYFVPDVLRQRLYAVNEVASYNGQTTGYVSAYERHADGTLGLAAEQPSGGAHPCHAVVDRSGSFLLVANYTGGTVASLPLGPPIGQPQVCAHNQKETGFVSDRQEKPHAHSIDLDPVAQRWAVSMDLGSDVAAVYAFDSQAGTLTPSSTFKFPNGTGPRHVFFSPIDPSLCYVVGELSNVIYTMRFSEGKFTEIQHIPGLPQDFTGTNLASEIDITPNGKFLYASMRGHDSIAVYQIDQQSGTLTHICHHSSGGKHPRHFTIDPTGQYMIVGNMVRP